MLRCLLYMTYKYFCNQTKISYVRANYRISEQAPPNEELHVQQGKHTQNSQSIFLFSHFMHVISFTGSQWNLQL